MLENILEVCHQIFTLKEENKSIKETKYLKFICKLVKMNQSLRQNWETQYVFNHAEEILHLPQTVVDVTSTSTSCPNNVTVN